MKKKYYGDTKADMFTTLFLVGIELNLAFRIFLLSQNVVHMILTAKVSTIILIQLWLNLLRIDNSVWKIAI